MFETMFPLIFNVRFSHCAYLCLTVGLMLVKCSLILIKKTRKKKKKQVKMYMSDLHKMLMFFFFFCFFFVVVVVYKLRTVSFAPVVAAQKEITSHND